MVMDWATSPRSAPLASLNTLLCIWRELTSYNASEAFPLPNPPSHTVLDPESYTVTSSIPVPGYAENMAQIGDNLYVTCWSYGNKVVRINTESDNVDKEVEVGVQPKYIVADGNDRLWVITDGGWEGNPAG